MIDGLFTLPKDILLEPIESLPETVLDRFEHKSGDFALTRPQSRTHTHIVNDSTAKLLQIFREPVTIADAIIRFSQTEHADPAATLDEAFPVLRTLIEAGMLLPSDSHLASPIEFLIRAGANWSAIWSWTNRLPSSSIPKSIERGQAMAGGRRSRSHVQGRKAA